MRLIRLKDGEKLVGLEAVQDPEETLSEVHEAEDSQPAAENRESDDAGDAQG